MNLNNFIKLFIEDRKVYCAAPTVESYKFYLSRFASWFNLNEYDHIDKQLLKNYIFYLRNTQRKNTSVHTNYRPVKAFVRWMYEEDYLLEDFTKGVKLPRQDPFLIEPLSQEEVNQIDQVILNQENLALRNYCIFHLMLDCGLRRQEVINMRHLDFKHDRIIIHNSKGNKDRVVLLPEFLYLNIKNYYDDVHYKHPGKYSGDYVFLNANKDSILTDDCIKKFFQRLKISSGVGRVHAHLCRHTFATSYLQYGGDMEKLRLLMGHSDYNVLRNYLHLSLVYPTVYKIDDVFFKR